LFQLEEKNDPVTGRSVDPAEVGGSIDEKVANVLTKPLSHVKFEHFQDKIGIVRKDLSQKGE
jgi:hypothetical protein